MPKAKAKAAEQRRISVQTRNVLAYAAERVGLPSTKGHEMAAVLDARGIFLDHEGDLEVGPVGTLVESIPEQESVPVDSEEGEAIVSGEAVPAAEGTDEEPADDEEPGEDAPEGDEAE